VYARDTRVLKENLDKLEKFKRENELVTHKISVELGKNFITPFDREDIHHLATSLGSITGLVWNISKQIRTYDLAQADKVVQIVAEQHLKFTKRLIQAIHELEDKKHLTQMIGACNEMRAMLTRSDDMIDSAVSRLLANQQDPYMAIKKTDQYDLLQDLCDKCHNAVNAIESIIIKYS
jgi:uncharacterized protein Yka (UPF0111/DUF47 family)